MVRDRSRQQCQNLHGAASSVATKQQLCSAEPVGHRIGLGIHWMWIGLVFVCAPWMLFCVWLPWIPQCRWIHKRKMPKRSALILTAMLAAFCLLALAVMVMFAVDAATSVDVGCHG